MKRITVAVCLALLLAGVGPLFAEPVEIDRDDTFIAYSNGIILDTVTGLEWVVFSYEKTDWHTAKERIENLGLDGGGWRMPTVEQLAGLRRMPVSSGTGYLSPVFRNTNFGITVWSDDEVQNGLIHLYVYSKGVAIRFDPEYDQARAFAVRNKK